MTSMDSKPFKLKHSKSGLEESLLEERLKIANVILPEDNLEDLVQSVIHSYLSHFCLVFFLFFFTTLRFGLTPSLRFSPFSPLLAWVHVPSDYVSPPNLSHVGFALDSLKNQLKTLALHLSLLIKPLSLLLNIQINFHSRLTMMNANVKMLSSRRWDLILLGLVHPLRFNIFRIINLLLNLAHLLLLPLINHILLISVPHLSPFLMMVLIPPLVMDPLHSVSPNPLVWPPFLASNTLPLDLSWPTKIRFERVRQVQQASIPSVETLRARWFRPYLELAVPMAVQEQPHEISLRLKPGDRRPHLLKLVPSHVPSYPAPSARIVPQTHVKPNSPNRFLLHL